MCSLLSCPRWRWWLACSLLLLGLVPKGRAQELKLQVARSVYLSQKEIKPVLSNPILFKNINKLPYYKNKKAIRAIEKYEKANPTNYEMLDSIYTDYVTRFGILNFNQATDLKMLWKLGEIKEVLGDSAAALYLYGIALMNQSKAFEKVKINYDRLRAARQNEYVDLDFYYKILAAKLKIDTIRPPKGVLLNMGHNINSTAPDYGPFMHPSGKFLLFTSRRSTLEPVAGYDYNQNEDLYYVQANQRTGTWTEAKRFASEINSRFNEGSACLSKDGKTLIFSRCNAPDGMGVCDLYIAEYDEHNIDKRREWINVRNMGPAINSKDWDSHPCLSADQTQLFFASNRKGGFGRTDLYVSNLQPDSTWGPAQNLGPIINTIEEEVTPFIHPINNTLYFASTGHLHNNGGFDIFKSRWMGSFWETPQNIGPLVNTERDEYYFSIDNNADTLFYANASAEDPRNFDLYCFPMPMAARPDAVYSLSGYLIDSITGQPITGIVAAFDLDKDINIEPIYINRDGFFEFRLINNRNYKLYVIGDNNLHISTTTGRVRDSSNTIFDRSVEARKPLVFENLSFEVDSSRLSPRTKDELAFLIDYLIENPEVKLIITGHTDSEGDSTYNLALSRNRAEQIKRYIMAKTGMADGDIEARGYGESRPIFPNDTEQNRARNRRVEFELIADGDRRNQDMEAYRRKRLAELDTTHAEDYDELLEDLEDEDDPKPKTDKPKPVTPNPTLSMNMNSFDEELEDDILASGSGDEDVAEDDDFDSEFEDDYDDDDYVDDDDDELDEVDNAANDDEDDWDEEEELLDEDDF